MNTRILIGTVICLAAIQQLTMKLKNSNLILTTVPVVVVIMAYVYFRGRQEERFGGSDNTWYMWGPMIWNGWKY